MLFFVFLCRSAFWQICGVQTSIACLSGFQAHTLHLYSKRYRGVTLIWAQHGAMSYFRGMAETLVFIEF